VYRRVGDPSSRLRFLLRTGSSGSLDQRHAPGGGLDRYERVSLQAQRRDDRGRQDLWVPVADVLHCDGLVPQFLALSALARLHRSLPRRPRPRRPVDHPGPVRAPRVVRQRDVGRLLRPASAGLRGPPRGGRTRRTVAVDDQGPAVGPLEAAEFAGDDRPALRIAGHPVTLICRCVG